MSLFPTARTTRATHQSNRLLRVVSQIRITIQPRARKTRATLRSLARLYLIFSLQKAELVFGTLNERGLPCQKSPSTKTATRWEWKVKSGRPGRRLCRRHPQTPDARNAARRRNSVDRLPRGFMPRIISERFEREKMSAISAIL